MEHLFDTCTFFNELKSPNDIINLGKKIKSSKGNILITNIVRDELEPHEYLEEIKIEESRGIIQGLEFCEQNSNGVKIICISDNQQYRANYSEIRKRYYSHISPRELQKKVKLGQIPEKEAKRLKKKDCGECSCIAIAITDPNNIYIVSEDEGKVCQRPDVNLFDIYRKSHNIRVFKFVSWLDSIQIEL